MDKVALLAFNNELEKLAWAEKIVPALQKLLEYLPKIKAVTKLQNYAKGAEEAIASGGAKNAIEYAKKFSTPRTIKGADGSIELAKPIDTALEANNGMFQRSLGDMFTKADDLKEGITAQKTFTQNASQFAKNLYTSSKQELQDASVKIMDADKANLVMKDNIPHLKGGGILSDRKILNKIQYDAQGKPIGKVLVKKRLLPRLGAQVMTRTGLALTTGGVGLLSGDSPANSTKSAITDYVSWSTPIGPALMLKDLGELGYNVTKNIFNKNNTEE